MPNRILKESICTSDSIDTLSWFEEVLFYRLIVNCDDYGRFDGRISVIKNRLFPLKEDLTASSVRKSVQSLVNAGLVALYEFEGKPYLHLPTWNAHQSVRAKRSKYPAPEDGEHIHEIICNHVKSDESKCTRNPIQSESNSKSESNTNAFAQWWAVYPKKVGKKDAEKAFAKVKVDVEILIAAVEKQKKSTQWCKDNGQFIPNPSTWLNQERWMDELDVNMGHKVPCGASGELGEAELEAIQRVLKGG